MDKRFLLVLLTLFSLVSCLETVNTVTTGTSSDSGTGTVITDPGCYAPGVGDRATDYYRFPDSIIGCGSYVVNGVEQRKCSVLVNGVTAAWASSSLSSSQQSNFVTDGLLKIRVVAKPNPGMMTDLGCMYDASGGPYTKLRVKLKVRARTNLSDYSVRETGDIAVGNCSTPLEFSVPANSLTEPFVVELIDVYSDLACIWSGGSGFGCPMNRHTQPDCFQFELQMATSWTKDFY